MHSPRGDAGAAVMPGELMQRYLRSTELQQIVADPEADVQIDTVKKFMEAAIADSRLSTTLRTRRSRLRCCCRTSWYRAGAAALPR